MPGLRRKRLEIPSLLTRLQVKILNSKTFILKDIFTPMFTAALFTVAKMWKQQNYVSLEDWMKKMWRIYTVEHYSAIRKVEILSFAITWMDPENIMLSKKSVRKS